MRLANLIDKLLSARTPGPLPVLPESSRSGEKRMGRGSRNLHAAPAASLRIAAAAAVLGLLASSCATANPPQNKIPPTLAARPTQTLTRAAPTPLPSATPDPGFTLWVSPPAPASLQAGLALPARFSRTDQPQPDSLRIGLVADIPEGQKAYLSAEWIYALAAPFPTITDGVSLADLKAAWTGSAPTVFSGHPILVDPGTKAAMESILGPASAEAVRVLPAADLLDAAWKDLAGWAILPFDALEPRWKVLAIDGKSPYDWSFDASAYPLSVRFALSGPADREAAFDRLIGSPTSFGWADLNRDPSKMTTVVMTGVTALVRATAWKMDTKGVLYPGRDIRDWLRDADITHVSNEVSFDPSCPPGNPNQISLQFCSRPEYLQLLQDVGVNVVELSGNHLNDWGRKAFYHTLDLYDQAHIQYFAGGRNLEEARKPLLIENHGNKIAFIGCNPPGPDYDWATATEGGAAPCDLNWEAGEISRLKSEGYLTIATFQYNESYTYIPGPAQVRDFRKLSEAGAVIVSGSQAHFPQTLEFDQGNLIHYGLGNLFFDQMAPIIAGRRVYGTEREFIDRHIFYNGRYLGTVLLTAMLEDYAKPRPMTDAERQSLLEDVFKASGW